MRSCGTVVLFIHIVASRQSRR